MDIIRIGSLARSHLGDKKAENRLQGYEFEYSPGDIDGAIKLALSKINFTDFPKTVYTVDDCEEYILILGVSYYLLKGKLHTKSRNSIDVESSRGNINRESNVALYFSLLSQLSLEFTKELHAWKRGLNIQNGFDC